MDKNHTNTYIFIFWFIKYCTTLFRLLKYSTTKCSTEAVESKIKTKQNVKIREIFNYLHGKSNFRLIMDDGDLFAAFEDDDSSVKKAIEPSEDKSGENE